MPTPFDTPAVRATGGTTSHSTRLPKDASQVHPQGVRRGCKGLKPQQRTQAGYQGERLLTKTVTTPFVLSALRSKVYRSMNGVATAVFRINIPQAVRGEPVEPHTPKQPQQRRALYPQPIQE